LLGIAGELGTLQAAYKKKLRDGEEYRPFFEDVAEELGDILWYVANVAEKFDLNLADIAAANLRKVEGRWPSEQAGRRTEQELDDHEAPAGERLPRTFAIEFRVVDKASRPEPTVQGFWNGEPWGSSLGDNAYMEDGYRFHDVFHLAHAVVLGWSPVARSLFRAKRRFNPAIDTVEDGGRAIVIEEGIVAFVYGHAANTGFLENVHTIDWGILKTIQGLTRGLEVSHRAAWEWERAIFDGYRVWRQLRDAGSGIVVGDLYARTLNYEPVPA
jgi:NTP pyrophosphatase (non-canonical NTP hydrolase)